MRRDARALPAAARLAAGAPPAGPAAQRGRGGGQAGGACARGRRRGIPKRTAWRDECGGVWATSRVQPSGGPTGMQGGVWSAPHDPLRASRPPAARQSGPHNAPQLQPKHTTSTRVRRPAQRR
jgi:hypothetical protein